jgi:hypothetical protein
VFEHLKVFEYVGFFVGAAEGPRQKHASQRQGRNRGSDKTSGSVIGANSIIHESEILQC